MLDKYRVGGFAVLTLAETTGTILRFIEPQVQTKIFKKLNGVSAFKINGFTKIERAPLSIILNKCRTDKKSCLVVLESIAGEYLGQKELIRYIDEKMPLPSMTRKNGPGIIAVAALLGEDETQLLELISQYEKILEEEKEPNEELRGEQAENIDNHSRNLEEGFLMDTYIGFIQEANHFFNFWPVYEYKDGRCLEIEDKMSAFPRYGNVNIFGDRRLLDANLADQEIYVVSFSADDLEDNIKYDGTLNSTEFKLNYTALKSEKKIKGISEIGLYPVLHPESGSKEFVYGDIPVIEIADKKDLALVQFGDKLYGPYSVEIKDRKHYVHIDELPNHIVVGYIPKQGTIESNRIPIPVDRDENTITYNVFLKDFEKVVCDLISDDQLISEFCNALSVNTGLNQKMFSIAEMSDILTNSQETFFASITNYPGVREKRLARIKELLSNEEFRDQAYEDVTKIFATLFATDGNSDSFKSLLEYVLEDPALSSKIQSFDIVRQNVAEKQAELKELTAKIGKEKQQLQVEQADEIIKLQGQLKEKEEQLKEYQQDTRLQETAEQARKDWEYYNRRYKDVKEDFEHVQANIKETLEDAKAQAARIAFEPMLSGKLIEAAASWENDNKEELYKRISQETCAFPAADMTAEELRNYICESVKKYRPSYEDNDILNIVINLTQNFLTVFSGDPGTGKTSICNIIAHVLGLGKVQKQLSTYGTVNTERYVPISVERGWTTKRDFIGYYNPLSKQVEKANAHLYDGLRILSAEGEKSKLPFVILLDEANLSPMEYYWADFMNLCDKNAKFNYINLGDAYQLSIPETCRFVSTINNDHTTEILSPRLIDRSATIVLPEVNYQQVADEFLEDDSFVRVISWTSLKAAFDSKEETELARVPKEIYENQICPSLKKLGISVSPRTDRAIKRFYHTAEMVFTADKNGTDPSIVALDYAIAQRLLTKINGSGDDYRNTLEELKNICSKSNVNLTHCSNILSKILAKGDSALHYYQFF